MGLKCHIVMPDDQAIEKSNLLAKFGATVERVKPVSIVNSRHYVNLARTRAEEIEGTSVAVVARGDNNSGRPAAQAACSLTNSRTCPTFGPTTQLLELRCGASPRERWMRS